MFITTAPSGHKRQLTRVVSCFHSKKPVLNDSEYISTRTMYWSQVNCCCFVKTCAPREGPTLLCGGRTTCTTGAFCVGSRKRLRGPQIFMCGNSSAQHVHFQFPPAQFHFYLAVHPPPLSFETPFRLSVALLPISHICPLLLTLRLSSLHTNGSS